MNVLTTYNCKIIILAESNLKWLEVFIIMQEVVEVVDLIYPALDLSSEGAVDDDRSSVNNSSQGGELNRTNWKEHADRTMEEYLLNCPQGSSNSGHAAAEREEPANMVGV